MSSTEENKKEQMDETTKVVLAALIGAGAGAAATLLLTTDKGSELLKAFKSPLNAVSEILDELAASDKEVVSSAKETAEAAVSDTPKRTK